jgi:hypothetical protein
MEAHLDAVTVIFVEELNLAITAKSSMHLQDPYRSLVH